MMDILSMNQNVFCSAFQGGKVSRLVKRKIDEDLIIPVSANELTYEEMEYIDGGGQIKLGIKFSFGAFVGSSVVASVVGFLSGYAVTKAIKFGAMIGGFWGAAIGLVVGALVAGGIAKAINDAIYLGGNGPKEITLIDINTGIFGMSFNYNYDLGNLLGIVIGGGGGFAAGYALGSSTALATA